MPVLSLGLRSLTVGGSLTFVNDVLQLVNDSDSPGNDYVYGTTSGGVKGWRTLAGIGVSSVVGTAGQVLVNGGVGPATGAVTFTLASALAGINSVTSVAGQNLVLAVGTGGTGLTIANSTLLTTLPGNLTMSGATATLTLGTTTEVGTLAVTAAGALTLTPKVGQTVTVAGVPIWRGGVDISTNIAIGDLTLNAKTQDGNNVAIGYYSMRLGAAASRCVSVGVLAGESTNTFDNTAIGFAAIQVADSQGNTAVGSYALWKAGGAYNVGIGTYAIGVGSSIGSSNTAIGSYSMSAATTGTGNVAVGMYALHVNGGNYNVALGYYAGKYETGTGAFYVNNQDRTDTAGDKAKSLLYGTFNATAASQTLTINAGTITGIGNLALNGATSTVTLGTATETLSIAVTAAGAGTVTTKSGQTLTLATGTAGITASGTGSHIFGTTNTVTLAAGVVTATGTGTHTFGTTNTVTMTAGALSATASLACTAATATLTLGTATEIGTIAVTSGGALTITPKAGQSISISTSSAAALNAVRFTASDISAIGTVSSSAALRVNLSGITSGTDQTGLYVGTYASTAATSSFIAGHFVPSFVDGSYTTDSCYGVFVANTSKGIGQTLTNLYAIYVAPQTAGTTTNYAFYSSGAGIVRVGDTTDASDATGATGSVRTLGGISAAKNIYAANIVVSPTANGIVKADSSGKINVGWIPTDELQIVLRQGSDAERQTIVFTEGEPVWTTDTHQLWVGDGSTLGGVQAVTRISGVTDATDATGTTGSFGTLGGLSVAKTVWTPTVNIGAGAVINNGQTVYIAAGTVGSPTDTVFTVPAPVSGTDTLLSIFGTTTLLGAESPTDADIVTLDQGATATSYYYKPSNGHWLRTAGPPTDRDAIPVYNTPNYVTITRKSTGLTLAFTNRAVNLDATISSYGNLFMKNGAGTGRWFWNNHEFVIDYRDNIGIGLGNSMVSRTATSQANIGFGQGALKSLTDGIDNIVVGSAGLQYLTTGGYNIAIGYGAGGGLSFNGSNNTLVGYLAGAGITGSGNVCLGNAAGWNETGSDAFYVDNQLRGGEALGKAGSLLYGTFNATAASQTLRVNASLSVLSGFDTESGRKVKVTSDTSTTFNFAATDDAVVLSNSSPVTANLLAAATSGTGRRYHVYNRGAGTAVIKPNGVEKINGAADVQLAQHESVIVICTGIAGAEWVAI